MEGTCKTTLLLFIVTSFVSLVKAKPRIYIGALFPSLPNKARVPGVFLEVGSRLALDHINNDTSVLPEYTLDMIHGDSKCDPKVSFNTMVKLLANPPNKLIMYGAACSDATANLAGMTAMANVVQVSHTSTSIALSDKSKYPSLYRAIPTDFPAVQATIALLKMFNWTRVAIIGEKTPSGLLGDTYNFAVTELRRLNINIQWNKIIGSDEIQDGISKIKENNVRIILTAVSAKFGKQLLYQAFHSGINGSQYVWLWLETYQANWWSEGDKMKDDMIKAVIQYSISFGDNLNVQDNTTTTVGGRTPRKIWQEYLHRLNTTRVPGLASYSYDGVWFIAKALDALVKDHGVKLEYVKTGNKSFYDLLLSKMKYVKFSGVTGDFKIYDKEIRERLDGLVHIYQYDKDGKAIEIMTYDISNNQTVMKSGKGFLWKDGFQRNRELPKKELIFEPEEIKDWIFIVLTVLCCITVFASIVFVAYLVVFIIRSDHGRTAAMFNIFICTGCICLSISGILYGLRAMNKLDDYDQMRNTCMSQFGLTSVGLTLILGGLISKLFGIFQIHVQGSSMDVLCGSIILPFLTFVAIDLVLVTLWLNEHSPKPTKIYYEKENAVFSMIKTFNNFCAEKKYSDWMSMIYIFHSVQVLISLILAVLTKGTSTREVDDGTWTRGSVIFSFLMLLGVILSDVPNRDSLSSLQNGYIIFTSVVSGCSLIILFQLYALKVCCSWSVETPKKNSNVRLTKMKENNDAEQNNYISNTMT